MSNCEKYEELCSAELDHALTSEEKQELDAHLAVCPSCCAYLADLREMRSLWKELEVPVPKDLHEKMMGAIEAEVQKTIVQIPQKHYRRPPVFTMLAAAAACVMLAVSGDLTGLFGQVSSMPLRPVTKEALPSTAEVQKPEPEQPDEKQLQEPIKEKERPEQQISPKQFVELPEQDMEQPENTVKQDAPKPPKPDEKQIEQETLDQIQEPQMDTAQVPMSIAVEDEIPQVSGKMVGGVVPPAEPAALGVPAELSQMQFARCYDITGGTELPILDDMTLLVTQEEVSYYSVENNESKIVQVQQELMKHGFEMTLNEVSGISIQRTAKTVLLIVHIE